MDRDWLQLCFMVLLLAGCGGKTLAAENRAAREAAKMAQMHRNDAPLPSPAVAQQPPPGAVTTRTVIYGSAGAGELKGYFARPANAATELPGVILFHEWWGLNDNIRDMAQQLAAAGYLVLAADFYHGQSAQTPEAARQLMQAALSDPAAMDANIQAAYDWLKHAGAAKVGTLGWCFGGSVSFEAAQVLSGKVDATVIYYGFVNDQPEALAKLKAPVLGLFGGRDQSIPTERVTAFQKGLEALGRHPEIRVYPDAGHAFANPSGTNYRAPDAGDAWRRTLDFLSRTLKS